MPGATLRWSMWRRYPWPEDAYAHAMSAVAPAAAFTVPPPALDELRDGCAPLGVYVHVPWCSSRCGYCDFNTYVPRGDEPSGFAATALAEIALMRAHLGDVRPATVFFGGGTPTLVDPADLARVLDALEPAPGAEVTVEANPETIDE